MILVPLLIIFLGFLIGLNHCAYRLDKLLSEKPVSLPKPEPATRTYAVK